MRRRWPFTAVLLFAGLVGAPSLRDAAALAMTEAYGMTGAFKASAQRGIDFALAARKTDADKKRADGEFDVKTAGWMVMLLKSGIMAELIDDKSLLKDAVADLEKLTDA